MNMDKYFKKIAQGQKKDGGFFDSSGAESIFYTSLILSCLNRCEGALLAKDIRNKAANFLLSAKNEDWIFSNDAGVEFCALSALAGYDKEIINAEAIGRILKNLISIEAKEGGPYFSYFSGGEKKTDKDIDLATNSIVAYFLHLLDVELPNLNMLIESAAEKGDFRSSFCFNPYPVIYFISQFYKGDKKNKLIDLVLGGKLAGKTKEKYWSNPLNAAMAISALLNFGYPPEKLGIELEYLKSLPEEELYKTYPLERKRTSTGELNMCFYLEAMGKFSGKKEKLKAVNIFDLKAVNWDNEEREMFKKILKLAGERFFDLPAGMKEFAVGEIQKTIKGNRDKQMSLMPFWFKKALGKKAERISDDLVVQLGLMNVFFWTAFIIYDDFWDEEGIPKILPTANLYARNFVGFFNSISAHNLDFSLFFRELMDRLDSGNTEILVKFRCQVDGDKIQIPEAIPDYGDYKIVYEPSSAHILSSIAMLYELGYRSDSPEMLSLISYFRNYLIAMQINDDIYDWEEDLKRGHLSTVVIMLLGDLGSSIKEIDMGRDLAGLKNIFWSKTLPRACKIVIDHTARSRQALGEMAILENPAPLEGIVSMIENAAKTALKERKYVEDLLKAYGG